MDIAGLTHLEQFLSGFQDGDIHTCATEGDGSRQPAYSCTDDSDVDASRTL